MIYTGREKLTVIEWDGATDKISLDILVQVILEKPSNMIYFVTERNRLYGIISMGDVARAKETGLGYVVINKNFTRVMKNEYMEARRIFCEKENINALPVVDENNVLLGDYKRWDDLRTSRYIYGEGGDSMVLPTL